MKFFSTSIFIFWCFWHTLTNCELSSDSTHRRPKKSNSIKSCCNCKWTAHLCRFQSHYSTGPCILYSHFRFQLFLFDFFCFAEVFCRARHYLLDCGLECSSAFEKDNWCESRNLFFAMTVMLLYMKYTWSFEFCISMVHCNLEFCLSTLLTSI